MTAQIGAWATASGEGGYTPPSPDDFWQPLWGEGILTFTRPMALYLIAAVVVGGYLLWSTSRASIVPTRKQFYVEKIYDFVRNDIGRDMIGSAHFKRFMPLLFTLFTFIFLNNLMGVIPFFQNPPMARIGFPIALTLVVYVVYHWVGLQKHGVGGYFKHMVPPGLPVWIAPFIFAIEFITYFITRPLTLALRLFGNMLAGHMVLVLFILGGEFLLLHGDGLMKGAGIASLIMGVLMTMFEILIQFLQAYVFTLLTASYIGSALADDH
ncbi:F0F1 ATP synthase subunit A [Gephyromycinifex aptenodytis]|uniref:F0F1 ATP synthase subunit A n=1 Tax=Gephyromycinifex aptenodytis TaxID=2716227 RepID=UPI0014480DE0|nr:F0F1 ATP synthase subunit A [Gephyromycinifex aptenodytis]